MTTAERKAVVGSPDLESLTTSHIERVFLSVRQELKRYQRKGLGYSKTSQCTSLPWPYILVCTISFVGIILSRQRQQWRAGIEEKPWSLERVVEMTETYWNPKLLMAKKEKAWQRGLAEDAMFSGSLG